MYMLLQFKISRLSLHGRRHWSQSSGTEPVLWDIYFCDPKWSQKQSHSLSIPKFYQGRRKGGGEEAYLQTLLACRLTHKLALKLTTSNLMATTLEYYVTSS